MRVLLGCSIGGAGHLLPVVAAARAFADQGHRAILLVPPSLAQRAQGECGAGVEVIVGGQPSAAVVDRIWERYRAGPAAEVVGLIDRELFAKRAADAMLPHAVSACVRLRPDLIIREPCEYGLAIAGHRTGVAQLQIAISQSRIEHGVLGVVAATLARHSPGVADAIRSAPFLSAFPKSLDPSPWPDTRRYRRFLPAHEPLPDWWPHDVRPLVYVTFGSVVGGLPEAGAVYRAALQAAGTLPVRVLLTVGSTFDPATLGPIPANAHVEPWVAQEDVLAEAALVICHGGSGTVLGALASGVPLVVCPLFADQSANAGMVQDAGAGVVVTSKRPAPGGVAAFGEDDVPSLRRAVTDTLADKLTARAVRQIAAEIARTPALGDVLVPPTRPDAGWIGVR